jgi:hypothetical protein
VRASFQGLLAIRSSGLLTGYLRAALQFTIFAACIDPNAA